MGKFYLTNNVDYGRSANNVIRKAGFNRGNKVQRGQIILDVFKKKVIDNENFYLGKNDDFIAVTGTIIYKEVLGKEGLNNLLRDFNAYDLEELRKNSIGHYAVIIRKKNKIYVFCDKYALYDVFYYYHDDKFVISNSYLGVVDAIEKRKLNEFALFEEVLTSGCIGRENVFKGMYRLFGNELICIEEETGRMDLRRLEYKRSPKFFYNDLNKAVKDQANNIQYVFSVIKKNFDKIAIKMTGGLDTRVVLAGLNSVNADYRFLHAISKNAVLNTSKEDLEIVALFSKKYKKPLYIMDWDYPSGPLPISEEVFYKCCRETHRRNVNLLEEFEGNIPDYHDILIDGYFGETMKARRWLECRLFKNRVSLKDFITKYHLFYDLRMPFANKKVRKAYINFLIDTLKKVAINDYHIPLKKDKILPDYFNELRQILSRTMDNHSMNFQNDFAYAMSALGDLKIYESCLNVPFRLRRNELYQSQIIKLLDKTTLEVPLFTHVVSRYVDKNFNLLPKKMSFREFMNYNFFDISRKILTLIEKLLGKKRPHFEVMEQYRKVLRKDPIFSKFFHLDKIIDVGILDAMYSYSLILHKYYYQNGRLPKE